MAGNRSNDEAGRTNGADGKTEYGGAAAGSAVGRVFPEINAIKVHATEATRKKLQEAEDEKKKTEAELGQTKEELENLNEEKMRCRDS